MSLAEADSRPQGGEENSLLRPAEPLVIFSRTTVMRGAVAVAALLCLASLATVLARVFAGHGQLGGLTSLFDMEQDGGVPSVFAAALMLGAAAVCAAGARDASAGAQRMRRHWRFLALAFVVLAVDELAGLHVVAEWVLAAAFGTGRSLALASGVLMAVVAGSLLLAYGPFLRQLPRRTSIGFLIAGAVYVFAAVGLDAASAWLVDSPAGSESPGYAFASLFEEVLELVGLLLFLDAGLAHLGRADGGVRIGLAFRA